MKVHVANLTRNIKIYSENPSLTDKRRGHMMFMHQLNVDLRDVELTNMGRTDKRVPLDDYSWDDLQEDPAYVPPRGAYTNPRGRYLIHFHRGGFNPALTPAHVEGVTVNNDLGWGFVNHSSRVNFIRNASYNAIGGALMTEAGDETGSFVENIALRSVNPADPISNPANPNALVDIREEFQDYSWQGDAFWFHSAGVEVTGNIDLSTPINATVTINGGNFNNSHTDIEIKETNVDFSTSNENSIGGIGRTMTISNVTFQNANRNIVMNPRFTLNQEVQDGNDFPDEQKNLYYFLLNDNITLNYGPFTNSTLYFQQQDANLIPITNSNYQLEVGPGNPPSDVIITVQYRNQTNAQLQALTNNPSTSFGGELLPNGTVTHPTIIGGLIPQTTLSTPDFIIENSFLMFPNPTENTIHFNVTEDFNVVVYDMLGKNIKEFSLSRNEQNTMDLSSWKPGIYLFQCTSITSNRKITKKVIKK